MQHETHSITSSGRDESHDPPVSAEAPNELPGLVVQAVGEADGERSKAK
jgi:hypothetical protein